MRLLLDQTNEDFVRKCAQAAGVPATAVVNAIIDNARAQLTRQTEIRQARARLRRQNDLYYHPDRDALKAFERRIEQYDQEKRWLK